MKNIFVALALIVTLGVSAQTKQTTTKTEVATQKLSAEALAEKDMKSLSAVITIEESVKAEVNKLFITKYRTKEEVSSPERMSVLSSYVESQLATFIGDANFAKIKANAQLYNQLVK